ncbi:unnamed protein product [Arabidopsis halleri]
MIVSHHFLLLTGRKALCFLPPLSSTLDSISHDGLSTSDDVSQHASCIYNVR